MDIELGLKCGICGKDTKYEESGGSDEENLYCSKCWEEEE